jgi:hypothetical protein
MTLGANLRPDKLLGDQILTVATAAVCTDQGGSA